MLKKIFFTIVLCMSLATANAQVDTLSEDQSYLHLPKRAAIWSAFIPGAGQIYNEIGYRKIPQKKHRAWWKVPIIYGGLAACGYYYYENNRWASLVKQEYQFRQGNNGATLDERFNNYSDSQLLNGIQDANGNYLFQGFDRYSKRRDIFIFAFIGVWGLNVIEAYVDAHFVTFDVSEDLTFSWSPTILSNRQAGLSFQFNFN